MVSTPIGAMPKLRLSKLREGVMKIFGVILVLCLCGCQSFGNDRVDSEKITRIVGQMLR